MKNRRFLILGASGFIGKNIVEQLLRTGEEVVSVYNKNSILDPVKREKAVFADLTIVTDIKKLFNEQAYTHVINCMGHVNHVNFLSGGAEVIDQHLISLFHQFQYINKDTLESYVYLGSADEYPVTELKLNESVREDPRTPYSLSKTAATHFLQMLHQSEGWPTKIVRVFLTYGPNQNENRFIPSIMKAASSQGIINTTEGCQVRDFCYISDLVKGILNCSLCNDARGEILNLASGEGIQIRDLVAIIANEFSVKVNYGVIQQKQGEASMQVADISKASDIIQWAPSVSLTDGIQRTITAYKKKYL
mgnify:CR=1 FL=1